MDVVNQVLINLRTRPELVILLLILMIISMLIIPLPTYLVDFLIGLNIVISVMVFLTSFYIDRILSFSTFPAVLLITTLFRLALSISTSRLILNDADAGEIIATFGLFVIGDNLIVGFVIFGIVTIVQFMVITKGAERVAEVAARFSLDAMPGKQMSIDADMKAGILDADGAKERRSVLERESQLYGSFDGAMKFIKGDAIAGIIVIFINFVGGVSVGMTQHGMDMSTALSTFTMLTIGDGLVAQIPSLLIAISAGLIVTRVNGDGANMGNNIITQLMNNHLILTIAAILSIGVGFLPGFPLAVFLLIAAMLFAVLYVKLQSGNNGKQAETQAKKEVSGDETVDHSVLGLESSLGLIGELDKVIAETIPLMLLVPTKDFERLQQAKVSEHIRSQFFIDYGINLPEILIKESTQCHENRVLLLINEIIANEFTINFDMSFIVNASDDLAHFDIDIQDENGKLWVSSQHKETLIACGYQLRPAVDELYRCIEASLSKYINEYFGVQETKTMMEDMEAKYPDLMKEVMRHATTQRISEVLQRLLSERISVRNLKLIMEALAVWAPREKDVIALVEHIRGVLGRYICHKFSVNNSIRVFLLSSQVEDTFRSGIRSTSSGAFLNLEPSVSDELMDLISVTVDSTEIAHKDIVILSSIDIRRFVKKFIETRFQDLEVISFGEISESTSVDVIKTI